MADMPKKRGIQNSGTDGRIIRASQANFDEIQDFIERATKGHNDLVDRFGELADAIEGNIDSVQQHLDGPNGAGTGVHDHADLDNVTTDQHHAQSHTMTDHSDGPYAIPFENVWEGVWDIATPYVVPDVVRHNDALYIAVDSSTGEEPTLP